MLFFDIAASVHLCPTHTHCITPDQGVLCRTLQGHGHWVNTMALSTDYALRTAAFDPGDRSLEHTGIMGMTCTSAELEAVTEYASSGCGRAGGIGCSFCSRRIEEESFTEIQHCQGRGGRSQISCDIRLYLSVFMLLCKHTFREANQNSSCLGQMTSHCFYGNQERARSTLQE